MTAKEIIKLLHQEPFPGLRVHVSDGSTYDVRHPEMMLVTVSVVMIALPPEKDGVPEHSVYCDPIHITRIEPLDTTRPEQSPKR